jgi:glycosyltransferase involved in cell wall biosynthesis
MVRVTLLHDWLTGMRGGEKCLEAAARRWPQARLFTLLHKKGSVSPAIEALRPRTSFLDALPGAHKHYRYLLPLMPAALASLDLPESDLMLSFSHCAVKAARPGPALHVCYCFTPMRYVWHMRSAYFSGRMHGIKAWMIDRLLDALRDWDRRTASRVHHFIAISRTVQQRIRECYDRESVVIYPPVDTDFYTPAAVPSKREPFYLVVSAFAPYKRLDLALETCRRLGRRLVVIGAGQDEARLKAQTGNTITFLGWQSDEVIRDHLRRCQALLFPGEEDFGIVPVEANACGTPVIAFGRGGATETVRDGVTGRLFAEQTVDCLAEAIESFEREAHDPQACRRQALQFAQPRYEAGLFGYLDSLMSPKLPLRRVA